MAEKVLKDIYLINESRPYIDCLYTVLTSSNKYMGPKYMLSGMTGFAFIFVAHKNLILASTEMYPLKTTAINSMEILGYYTETYDGIKTSPTFTLYQKRAIQRIKESIDGGVAVILWDMGVPDFSVIFGYDDEDEVFFYKDRCQNDEQVLLYKNFGRAGANYWMCQIIGERVNKDIRDIYFESLEFAVDCFETPYIDEVILRKEFASGKMAYKYLLDALNSEEFYDLGLGKLLYYNALSRNEAYLYLNEVKEEIPEVYPAYLKYMELNEIYKLIKKLLPDYPRPNVEYRIDRKIVLPDLTEYCIKAYEVEEEAIGELKYILRERLNNRYVDIYDVKKYK